ncbi:MAG: TolC family protein [Polyangiaceae bacterium]
MRTFLSGAVAAGVSLATFPAFGLQPLEAFLDGAHKRNPDMIAADASVRQKDAEADVARGKLLPSFTARGVYTRNQFEAVFNTPNGAITILPQDQFDAFFLLDVPIVDAAQFARYGGARILKEIAEASKGLTQRAIDERVVRAYVTVAATTNLGRSAEKSFELAEKNRKSVEDRVTAGVASELDLERAKANVERAKQDIADANLSRVLAIRTLETLTRIKPEEATQFPEDDLHEEAPLASWVALADGNLPERRLSEAERRLALSTRDSAKLAFIPALGGQAQERFTNATGFAGRVGAYTLSASLTFRFDFGLVAQLDSTRAAADVSVAKAEGVRRSSEDAIVEAWYRIGASIAKGRAARAQARAATRAATIAEDRYAAGAATQLDVTTAQRDAFAAEVGRIGADLDLTLARAVLRLASGKPTTFRGPVPSASPAPSAPPGEPSK